MTDLRLTPDQIDWGFASLAHMKEAHLVLLRRRGQPDETFLTMAFDFLKRGSATGILLGNPTDRDIAQSFLEYWSNHLFRITRKDVTAAVLADFDDRLEPEIPDSKCPYRGLEAFGAEHQDIFYGRRPLVDFALAQIARNGTFLPLVGPSGNGKSSL